MSVTLYTVWRNYHNQWECVSIEAEEKPSTFVLPQCDQSAAFGYMTRMYKDDRRVCRSPQEAWDCAIQQAEEEFQRATQQVVDIKQAMEHDLGGVSGHD